jgi:uncharacterized protein YlaI
MPISLGWASSASRLANKPIRYAIADEIEKLIAIPMHHHHAPRKRQWRLLVRQK